MKGSQRSWRIGAKGLVVAGGIVSGVFWLLDSSSHVIFFADSDVFEAVFAPTWHELWMRLAVVGLFMAFAFVAGRIVTARRRAVDTATRALAEVDQVFETAANGMRIVDKDFRVLRANDAFARLVGLPKHEVIGRKCHEVFPGEMCDTPECPLTRLLNGGQSLEYDADKVRPDGTSVACIVSATSFRQPDGTFVGIVEDFRDISGRKRVEMELQETGERLRELTAHLQGVREQERSRIARELHDELGQALTALSLDVRWLTRRLPADRPELNDKAMSIGELISVTADSVRRICSACTASVISPTVPVAISASRRTRSANCVW